MNKCFLYSTYNLQHYFTMKDCLLHFLGHFYPYILLKYLLKFQFAFYRILNFFGEFKCYHHFEFTE